MEEAQSLKNDANKLFQEKKYEQAQNKYEEAIKSLLKVEKEKLDKKLLSILHSNIAACLLISLEIFKDNQDKFLIIYEKCVHHCNLAISSDSYNIKALYRRASAHKLSKNDQLALRDFHEILKIEPKNKAAQEGARSLISKKNEKEEDINSIEGCVKILRNPNLQNQHENAITNLVVNSREEDELSRIGNTGIVPILSNFIKNENNNFSFRLRLGSLKILNRLLQNNLEKFLPIVQEHLTSNILNQIIKKSSNENINNLSPENEDIIVNSLNLYGCLIQVDFNNLEKKDFEITQKDIDNYEKEKKEEEEKERLDKEKQEKELEKSRKEMDEKRNKRNKVEEIKEEKEEIKEEKKEETKEEKEEKKEEKREETKEEKERKLKFRSKNRNLNEFLESSIEIFWDLLKKKNTTNRVSQVTLNEVVRLPWNRSFAELFSNKYFKDLLLFGCESKDILSVAINKIGSSLPENLYGPIKKITNEFVHEYLNSKDIQNNFRGLTVLNSLLLANLDLGIDIFLNEISNIIDSLDQLKISEKNKLVISEIFAYASGHKTFQKVCKPEVLEELLILLQSDDNEINARVISATCKLAAGNRELSSFIMEKDNGKRQIKIIINTLNKKSSSSNAKQWSIEALTFLTLNPKVKELIVNDNFAIDTLMTIAKEDKNLRYGIALCCVNIVKYLPKLDETEKLKQQINAYANAQKGLQIDPLDEDEAVLKRCKKMIEKGIVSLFSLLVLGDPKANEKIIPSPSTCEEISRALCSLASDQFSRGKIVQEGGIKTLLFLYSYEKNINEGRKLSAHGLAKIAISIDPKIYSGTLGTQMILPLKSLLNNMEENIESFEGLMGLTNLILLGKNECELLKRDKGLSKIEMFQISQNPHMQRVATELLTNLLMIDQDYFDTFKNYELRETAITLFGAFMQSDDVSLRLAASGACAMLSEDPEICANIIKRHKTELPLLVAIEFNDDETLIRVSTFLKNILKNEDFAKEIIFKNNGHLVLLKLSSSKNNQVKEVAEEMIEDLKKRKLLTEDKN